MNSFVTRLLGAFLTVLLLSGLATVQAQQGVISGQITEAGSDSPLPGASVLIVETEVGTAADVDGNYTLGDVEPGEYTLRVSFVGYETIDRDVVVEAGEEMQVNFELEGTARRIEEVVVTGVGQETPQANLSFEVSQVSSEDLTQVTASSPLDALQGKVAGVDIRSSSGEPGSGSNVNLRAATTLTGGDSPLFIVDGVILGSSQVDIGALDIKNIEVVKGAAASSLYGSRAQNGVINITTKRGQSGSALGQTRATFRSEVGVQSLEETAEPNMSHGFKARCNTDQGFVPCGELDRSQAAQLPQQFVNEDGEPVNYGDQLVPATDGPNGTQFYDRPYENLRKADPAGEPYDVVNPFDQFFSPGNSYTNYVAISQNSQSTNFRVSYEDQREGGVVAPPSGDRRDYNRKRFRLNLDHRPTNDVAVSASGFYADIVSNRLGATDFNPFFDLMFTNPLSDLTERDAQGELVIKPDPRAVEANPLYAVENAVIENNRARFLGNLNAEYSPFEWATLEGNFSYDRLNRNQNEFYKRGFKTRDPSQRNSGELDANRITDEAINYSFTASFAEEFGDLTTRSQLKYQGERQKYRSIFATGNEFSAIGLRNFENINDQESKGISSNRTDIRSESFYVTAEGSYDDRYILDALLRRDGSSLFGEAERWQTYYRVAGAWRLSEEAFFPAPEIFDQFKLRVSQGTAGARPNFSAQYETYSINDGNVSKSNLGNAQLKPEFQTEREFGVDIGLYNRVFLTFNYVDTKVEDQLLQVPLSGPVGFSNQWQNAGTLESTVYEANLDVTLVQNADMAWEAGLTFDKTQQEITEFGTNPYRTGPNNLFYYRDDEVLGAMYGAQFVTSTSQLETMELDPSKFQKNDDGLMVPVGDASWRDGFNGDQCDGGGCWGTSVSTEAGDLDWGVPFIFEEDGDTFQKIGDTVPDFNLNFSTNFSYKGFTAYALLSYQSGGDVYNQTRQYSYRDRRHADVDDAGVAQEKKKPDMYYAALYNKNANASYFVEDGTYLKVQELSLGYDFDEAQLNSLLGSANPIRQLSINLSGQNLFTFTDYTGLDPAIGGGGRPSVYRVDNFQYPPFRTITGRFEIQF